MRVLLIGGGCRGLELAGELVLAGHAVRVVTREESRRAAIEQAGAECWIGDPDVVGTLRYALESVTILVWALGTASGTPAAVAALHGPRLEMMLGRAVDTTVRAILYEAAGSVPAEVLAAGAAMLRRTAGLHQIPCATLECDPADRSGWVAEARAAIGELIG